MASKILKRLFLCCRMFTSQLSWGFCYSCKFSKINVTRKGKSGTYCLEEDCQKLSQADMLQPFWSAMCIGITQHPPLHGHYTLGWNLASCGPLLSGSILEFHVCMLVAQSCPTLCDPRDYSPPGFSICGILQARILEWIAIPFSRRTSQPRDRTLVSCTAGRF